MGRSWVVRWDGQELDVAAAMSPHGPVHAVKKAGTGFILFAWENSPVMLGRHRPLSRLGNLIGVLEIER
jgi:hypothetical protein